MGSIAPKADTESLVTEPTSVRRAILAAARRVAERDGILDLSLLSVAQEAGVAPGSVYACFTSKNDLLLSVIADDLGTLARAMRNAFDSRSDDDGVRPSAPILQLPAKEADETGTAASIAPNPDSGTSALPPAEESDADNSDAQAPNSGSAIDAIAKLQETVARLETRPVDAWLERRLREFERALSALEGRQTERSGAEKSVEERFRELSDCLESLEHKLKAAAEDASRSLARRIDECENRLRSVASDTHGDATALATRVTALENAAFAVKPEFFAATAVPASAMDRPAEPVMPDPAPQTASAEPIVAAATPTPSYLAAARKSAQAAAVVQDSHARKSNTQQKSQTMVYLAMGSLFLFVAMLVAAGLLLRNVTMNAPAHAHNNTSSAAPRPERLAPAPAPSPQEQLRILAQAGDPNAALLIGLKYLDGNGATKNDAVAFAWLSRAAARNQPVAQYELGAMYENGRGVRSDPAQAFRWFESAALKGNRKAMHSLANAYAEGRGTQTNMFEAARWYGRAAQLGSVNDQFNLGVLFERGMGVTQSLPDAYKWYAIAAAQGDRESQSRIAAIAPMLAPDDLAAAQSAAQSFRPDTVPASANSPPTLAPKR